MNERIKELYTSVVGDDKLNFDSYLAEKFAELIVRECIMLQYRRGVEGFGIAEEQMIKRHFGINT